MPWTRTSIPYRRPAPPLIVLTALVLAAGSTIFGVALSVSRDTADRAKGQVVVRAYDRARASDDAAAEDQDLTDDKAVAGATWARAHSTAGPTTCPNSPKAFEQGCMSQATTRSTRL